MPPILGMRGLSSFVKPACGLMDRLHRGASAIASGELIARRQHANCPKYERQLEREARSRTECALHYQVNDIAFNDRSAEAHLGAAHKAATSEVAAHYRGSSLSAIGRRKS